MLRDNIDPREFKDSRETGGGQRKKMKFGEKGKLAKDGCRQSDLLGRNGDPGPPRPDKKE